jgi:hypothetical protein
VSEVPAGRLLSHSLPPTQYLHEHLETKHASPCNVSGSILSFLWIYLTSAVIAEPHDVIPAEVGSEVRII